MPPSSPTANSRHQKRIIVLPVAVELYPVQRLVFSPKIPKQRSMAQRPAGDAPDQVARAEALAGPMDLFVQPILEPDELAAAEVGIEIAQVLPSLLHELGGVEVAERIRGEIAKPAHAPADVLQPAAR